MITEYSKTFKPHVLRLKISDKIDLRRGEKISPYQIVFITHGKTLKKSYIIINLNFLLQLKMIHLNCQMDHT